VNSAMRGPSVVRIKLLLTYVTPWKGFSSGHIFFLIKSVESIDDETRATPLGVREKFGMEASNRPLSEHKIPLEILLQCVTIFRKIMGLHRF
jgi:hypothetical protein